MKKHFRTATVLFVAALSIGLTGCAGFKSSYDHDFGQTTVAPLDQNNFRVVKRVRGESSQSYIFGIGGFSNQALKNSAVTNMYDNAGLTGAQTIVDVKVVKFNRMVLPPLYYERTVVATGTVIEFTGPHQDMHPRDVRVVE